MVRWTAGHPGTNEAQIVSEYLEDHGEHPLLYQGSDWHRKILDHRSTNPSHSLTVGCSLRPEDFPAFTAALWTYVEPENFATAARQVITTLGENQDL